MQLRLTRDTPKGLDRVLLPGEKLVVAVHSHWATLIEPVASTVAALALAIWIDSNVTRQTQAFGTIFWWVFIAVLLRLLWILFDYGNHWFLATDKRLLLRYGIITKKVAMMPLLKVTDMSYVRTAPGRVLGYGKFVLESAGQDQALREVKWVPDPDRTYRVICAEIFHISPPPGDEDYEEIELPDFPDDGPRGPRGPGGPDSPGGPTPPGSPISPTGSGDSYPDVHRTHNPVQERLDSYSRAVPVQRGPRPETVYESDDLKRRRRGADTGPIWPVGERGSRDA
ncbi:PH domain-containing protein [Intrasporangium flavum]|uniref:PH domain-containing protein n=1 Tax=Intrasporangium flavum TaxID=1428657 RepID=UPI00096DF118|nr:PH domain-containing protein [Intrasporangium flavum]